MTGFFRLEKVGRFAASAVNVTFALAAFGVERPRRDESQTGSTRVLNGRQVANVAHTLADFFDILKKPKVNMKF